MFKEENWGHIYTSLVVQKGFSTKETVASIHVLWAYISVLGCQRVEKFSKSGILKWSSRETFNTQRIKKYFYLFLTSKQFLESRNEYNYCVECVPSYHQVSLYLTIYPFLPNTLLWSPWKHQKTFGFQGGQNGTLGRKESTLNTSNTRT